MDRKRFARMAGSGLRRVGDDTERIVAARALAFLFASGGALAVITVAVPHHSGWNDAGVLVLALLALGTAAILVLGGRVLPYPTYFTALVFSILLIDGVILFSHEVTSPFVAFYTWSGLFAFYFLTLLEALAIVLWSATNYSLVLVHLGAVRSDAPRWVMVEGTIVVVGAFIWFLRKRERRLIERLADAANRDHLTGCLNRRGFEPAFELELERARRSGAPAALVVCDLDHFKELNDKHGHPFGDQVLVAVARVLADGKRKIDTLVRLGGEEFGLLLPGTDSEGAFIVAERARRATRDAVADLAGVDLTASFGVASFPHDGHTSATLLSAADQALYAAKQLGRDRVVVFKPELTVSVLSLTSHGDPTDQSRLATILMLAEAVDLRDVGTAEHSLTVGRYARLIAEELGLAAEHVDRIAMAGVLHDVGKVAIPDAILRKPGPLSLEEQLEMRRHCELGERMLRGAQLDEIANWVGAHHERPDGTGYPLGLIEGEIPLESSILAVADAYEAMIADRAYRRGLGHAVARKQLLDGRGTQFDADLVDLFLSALDASRNEPAVG
jgi:diguanylate cyclase (GGDEF)-like protein/putative nucleotidyltransferase with HDIG domain